MSDKNRIVLAYSGGLDTSVAIPYLKDRTGKGNYQVRFEVSIQSIDPTLKAISRSATCR